MSVDYAFWKWQGEPRISRGLCYLLLCDVAEIPEVETLDTDRLEGMIHDAFPELADPDAEHIFECNVYPIGLTLETYSDTPDRVFEWFFDLAHREGMVFFDPQSEEVTEADVEACRSRLAAIRAAADAHRWRGELPAISAGAEEGDPKAIVELGNRYSLGEGVERDLKRAAELYARAADLGHADGMFNLASCYRLGEGVDADVETAIRWYRRAMAEDKLFAAFALGEIFAAGEGLPADPRRAVEYFQIAREHGHQDAPRELRKLGALPPLPTLPPPAGFWHTWTGWVAGIVLVAGTSFLDAVIPPLGIPLALLVIWALLRVAGEGWRDLGLRRPDSWPRTLGLAAVCAAALQATDHFVIAPVLQAAGAPLPDLSRLAALEGNLPMLLLFLTVSWTTAGFGEEAIWRGFVMARAARLFGGSRDPTRGAWIAALLTTSVVFGLLHAYQGTTGMVLTGFAGLVFGLLYLASGRNLWLPVLTHALTDTLGVLVLYFGWAA